MTTAVLAGKFEVNFREGKVAKGRVQNGKNGRWVQYSATWKSKQWEVTLVDGTSGIAPARQATICQKVSTTLGVPKAAA